MASFGFNFQYTGVYTMSDRLNSIVHGAGHVGGLAFVALAVMWLLALVSLVRSWRRAGNLDPLTTLAVVWLPVEVVLSSLSGRARVQYSAPWLVPIAMLVALTLAELQLRLRGRPRAARLRDPWALALAVLVICAFSGALLPTERRLHELAGSVLHYQRYSVEKPGEPYRQMVRLIDAETRPDDYLLVWGGYSADVNFLSNRTSPTSSRTQRR